MKDGDWPKVASIFRGLDHNKVHQLAKPELSFVEYQLKAREEQKMLLEGLKSSYGTNSANHIAGWVDNAGMETKQLEIAVYNCSRSAAQKRAKGGASLDGEVNMHVVWLLKTCERVIEIRKTIAALAFDDALMLAKNAKRDFDKEAHLHQTEWKHFVKEELDGYVVELERRKGCVESVELIKAASLRCDVVGLKSALKQAESLHLEKCPELGMRQAIIWGKQILKECVGLDKKIALCMVACDGVGLADALNTAERLGLVTELTVLGKIELKRLNNFRAELSNIVGRANGAQLTELLGRTPIESKFKRVDFTKMQNWNVVEYMSALGPSVKTYVQLELAKMAIYAQGLKSEGMVDHRHHVSKMDDVVSLTVRIKQEKVFGVKEMQKKYKNVEGWEGLRPKEEFGRSRMVYDKKRADGMMKFSGVPILTSLTKLPENLSALAVRLFRQNILGWVGSRVFSHPVILLRQILVVCLKVEGVRDEMYVCIMKQLNGCSQEVKVKLWVLMKICLGVFPPSKAFENYLEFFLIREGSRECVYALHECSTAFVLKSETPGVESSMRVGELDEIEAEVEKETAFFSKVDFEQNQIAGQKRLDALERVYSDSKWRGKWSRAVKDGRTLNGGESFLKLMNEGMPNDSDLAKVAWLITGGEADKELVMDVKDVESYLRDIHPIILEAMEKGRSEKRRASRGPTGGNTWEDCRFDSEWFKVATKIAKKQIFRVKNNKCGGAFRKVLHSGLRAKLQAAALSKKERLEAEKELQKEWRSDDEIDISELRNPNKVTKKRGGVAVRKTETGQIVSTSVGGFNESAEAIKLPNKFKLEDSEKQKGSKDNVLKLDGAKGESTSRVRFNSRLSDELLLPESDEEVSGSDWSDDEEASAVPGSPKGWGALKAAVKSAASFDIADAHEIEDELSESEEGAGSEKGGGDAQVEMPAAAVVSVVGIQDTHVAMQRPLQKKKQSKTLPAFRGSVANVEGIP
jgi:hypothetical protein